MKAVLGDFELSEVCCHSDCEEKATKIIILFEYEAKDMTVSCLCTPHAIYHKSLFFDSEKN